MTGIVRTAYRYKHPPRKRKAVALEVPAVVRADKAMNRSDDTTGSTRLDDPTGLSQRPPAIVTIRRKPERLLPPGLLPETPEEHQRRGDAADALWRELVRRVAEKP